MHNTCLITLQGVLNECFLLSEVNLNRFCPQGGVRSEQGTLLIGTQPLPPCL